MVYKKCTKKYFAQIGSVRVCSSFSPRILFSICFQYDLCKMLFCMSAANKHSDSDSDMQMSHAPRQPITAFACNKAPPSGQIFLNSNKPPFGCYYMKKVNVPQCQINENLFIIDSTPWEDAVDNRFGLNSEKNTITLFAMALWTAPPGGHMSYWVLSSVVLVGPTVLK